MSKEFEKFSEWHSHNHDKEWIERHDYAQSAWNHQQKRIDEIEAQNKILIEALETETRNDCFDGECSHEHIDQCYSELLRVGIRLTQALEQVEKLNRTK